MGVKIFEISALLFTGAVTPAALGIKEFVEMGTLLVAAAAFVFTLFERNSREKREEIAHWQKYIVYEIVKDGTSTFKDISDRYVAAAARSRDTRIPKTAIQDDALGLALLSLLEANLISFTADSRYLINVVSKDEEHRRDEVYQSLIYRESMAQMGHRIVDSLRKDGGKFTVDQLIVDLKPEDHGLRYLDVNGMTQQMLTTRIIVLDKNQRVWLGSQMPRALAPYDTLRNRELMNQMATRVIDLLHTDGGKYTVADLITALKPGESGLTFLDINSIVQQMISTRIVALDKGQNIWLTSKMPKVS